jgi:hypothetical protein
MKVTAFCQQANGKGTIWIESFTTLYPLNTDYIVKEARKRCAEAWDYAPEDVHCLGLIKGDVEILVWEDIE